MFGGLQTPFSKVYPLLHVTCQIAYTLTVLLPFQVNPDQSVFPKLKAVPPLCAVFHPPKVYVPPVGFVPVYVGVYE